MDEERRSRLAAKQLHLLMATRVGKGREWMRARKEEEDMALKGRGQEFLWRWAGTNGNRENMRLCDKSSKIPMNLGHTSRH